MKREEMHKVKEILFNLQLKSKGLVLNIHCFCFLHVGEKFIIVLFSIFQEQHDIFCYHGNI